MDIWQFSENNIEILTTLKVLPEENFIWIDGDPSEVPAIIKQVEQLTHVTINETHIDDFLNLNHPCFYDSTQAYDVMIFRSLVSHDSENCTETKPISFLIFRNLLVTFNNHDEAIKRVKKRFETTRKQLPHNPLTLTFLLLDEIIDNFLDLRGSLQERFLLWQSELFAESKQPVNWVSFLNFKTEIRKLRILSEDQQEVVYQWRQDNETGMNEQFSIHLNDLADHIHRIIRYTTQLENDLDTLIQLHYSLIGNRTNEVMRVLTVVSAIFLPLNLIAGIFGMNFVNMHLLQVPGGANIALLGMGCLAITLFVIFKLKKWI